MKIPFNLIAAAAALSLPTTQSTAAVPSPKICFDLIAHKDWGNSSEIAYGIYSIAPDSGRPELTAVATDPHLNGTGGAAKAGEYYFTTYYSDFIGVGDITHYIFRMSDWQLVETVEGTEEGIARCLAYDEKTSTLYGCFLNPGEGSDFGYIDIHTGERTSIRKSLPSPFMAMAFDDRGVLYAIDADGMLMAVDKYTGETEVAGDTGCKSIYSTSAAFDPATGRLYYMECNNNGSSLHTLNRATGEATRIMRLTNREQCVGMYVAEQEANESAPAAVTGLSVNPHGNTLSGAVSFDSPSSLFDGSPASGNFTWHLSIDGMPYSEGNTTPGTRTETEFSVTRNGTHTFTVFLSNSHGNGPEVTVEQQIGREAEPAVTSAALTRSQNTLTLSWSVSGDKNLTFDIIRNPDGKTMADGISGNTWSCQDDALQPPHRISFTVTPHGEDSANYGVSSNGIVAGTATLPYSENLDSPESMDVMEIADCNRDGLTWHHLQADHGGCAVAEYSISSDMDDWLILPPMQLAAGKEYVLEFDVYGSEHYAETLEARLLPSPVPDPYSPEIAAPFEIRGDKTIRRRCPFTPAYDGIHYPALHGISAANRYRIYIDNISVALSSGPVTEYTIPMPPTGATLTETGTRGTVRLAWHAPTHDINGTPLDTVKVYYNVYNLDMEPVAERIESTSTEIKVCSASEKAFAGYVIRSLTSAGENVDISCRTPLTAVGKSILTPFRESFASAAMENEWGVDATSSRTSARPTASYGNIVPSDSDGGFMLFTCSMVGDSVSLVSEKILGEPEDTYLRFMLYVEPDAANTLRVKARHREGETLLWEGGNKSISPGWLQVDIPLSEVPTTEWSIIMTAVCGGSGSVAIDNIEAGKRKPSEPKIVVESFSAPRAVNACTGFTVSANISNTGNADSAPFPLTLTVEKETGGKSTEHLGDCPALAPGTKYTVTYDDFAGAEEKAITYSLSGNAIENDMSIAVEVRRPKFPAVTDFHATISGDDIIVEWEAPDLKTASAESTTDDCELYTPFSIGMPYSEVADDYTGGWTTEDWDDSFTHAAEGSDGFPLAYPNATIYKSFMVFSPHLAGAAKEEGITAGPRSGTQCFAAFANSDGTRNDDWLISPRLTGEGQTVRLYARAGSPHSSQEKFEIWWCPRTTDATEFTRLAELTAVADRWLDYSVTLPDGARHFAVRYVSEGCGALFVDDIQYESEEKFKGLKINGYHVYADGERISSTPASGYSYIHEGAAEGSRRKRYSLAVVYDKGLGERSAERVAAYDGIDAVDDGAPTISAGKGFVEIYAGETSVQVAISDFSGRTIAVFSMKAGETCRRRLDGGLYIISAGTRLRKAIAIR